jgi:DNA-binding MarR family transcriptional regulator
MRKRTAFNTQGPAVESMGPLRLRPQWTSSRPLAKARDRAARLKPHNFAELIALMERLHRRLLHIIKLEIEGLGVHDIHHVQAMMLFDIGNAGVTIGELAARGFYLVSNVSYNVDKMIDHGYLTRKQSVHDRRSFVVRATKKGRSLCRKLDKVHLRDVDNLHRFAITVAELKRFAETLRKLDSFWMDASELTAHSGHR